MRAVIRFLVASGFLFPLLCPAIETTASLNGRVEDSTGRPVPAARVDLYTAGQVSVGAAETDAEGRFRFERLPAGSYLVRAARQGFADVRNAVRLEAGQSVETTMRFTVSPVRSEVTVTAETNQVEDAGGVAQRVNVIPFKVLEERVSLELTEGAAGETGVGELRTSPAMGAFFVRGLTGKNVAIYKDGVRYTTAAQRGGVSTFVNMNDASGLEAVEMLRGPNSAQYGSDSIGGTVNMLSRPATIGRTPAKTRFELAPFYQSAANAFGAEGLASYGGQRFGFTSTLAGRRANSVRAGAGLDSHAAVTRFLGLPSTVFGIRLPDTSFTQYGGSFHAQYRLAAQHQVIGHYERRQVDGAKRYDQLLGGDGNLIADLGNLMLDFGYLRYQGFAVAGMDQISATGSYNTQREDRVNQGGQGNPMAAIVHQYERTKAWGLQLQAAKTFGRQDFLVGAEGYDEAIVSPAYTYNPATGATVASRPRVPDGAQYLSYGIFVQDAWAPVSWLRMSGALRFGGASYRVAGASLWPSDSLSANAFSGRAGVVVTPWKPLALYGQYSRGFRAPNVTDLGTLGLQGNGAYEASFASLAGMDATLGDSAAATALPTGTPVEKLRPETSDNLDVGARLETARVRVELTAFWIDLGNAIVSQTLILPPGAVGTPIGDQVINRQLPTGAVFVPISTGPVLVRANFSGAHLHGLEHSARLKITPSLFLQENITWVYAADQRTGLPPDIEPGIPPLTLNASLLWAPASRRFWVEAYGIAADRQSRLPSIALSDRRVGAARSRSNIAAFFSNGALVRGLVQNGILLPTGETLAQVQNRVLGTANSAPMFTAIPGFGAVGVRAGVPITEDSDFFADFFNINDHNYRGIGWGVDASGIGVTLRYRIRF